MSKEELIERTCDCFVDSANLGELLDNMGKNNLAMCINHGKKIIYDKESYEFFEINSFSQKETQRFFESVFDMEAKHSPSNSKGISEFDELSERYKLETKKVKAYHDELKKIRADQKMKKQEKSKKKYLSQ